MQHVQQYNQDHFFYFITTRKAAKWIKNNISAVNGQGLADNYKGQIQGQSNPGTE